MDILKNMICSKVTKNIKMMFKIVFLVSVIMIANCSTEPETDEPSLDIFTTHITYSESDTITVVISNDSTDVFIFGLRGGEYLEMFYQKEENGEWSDNQWLWYMSTMIPTVLDSVQPGDDYSYKLPAEWLEDVGTFRFVMSEKYSNRFVIN